MNPKIDWKELKYQIADKLFAKELDEAFNMGLSEGARFATSTISFKVYLKESKQDLTKTQAIGYRKAMSVVEDCKEEIRHSTGANVWRTD